MDAPHVLVEQRLTSRSPEYAKLPQASSPTLAMSPYRQALSPMSWKRKITLSTPFFGSLNHARTQRMRRSPYG